MVIDMVVRQLEFLDQGCGRMNSVVLAKVTEPLIVLEAIPSFTLDRLEIERNQLIAIRLCEFAFDFVACYNWTNSRGRSCKDYVSFLNFKGQLKESKSKGENER
jgi:hypothetical protein